jgi:hypothetical protein
MTPVASTQTRVVDATVVDGEAAVWTVYRNVDPQRADMEFKLRDAIIPSGDGNCLLRNVSISILNSTSFLPFFH